eukprot:GHVH01011152.1.p1 GENE.GHVH01011152.1~~GHVH01011152.1.p1  ORF type:complete len:473 (+),score=50.76 GHVH01011152.1:186-1421(+)
MAAFEALRSSLDDRRVDEGEKKRRNYDRMNRNHKALYEDIDIKTPSILSSFSTPIDDVITGDRFFKSMFMLPLSFIELPDDLDDWLLSVRPEGTIAHLIIKNGKGTVRGKSGTILHQGSIPTFPNGTTILYGIYQDHQFHVFDVLIWNDIKLCEFEAENRLLFGSSRLSELSIDTTHHNGNSLVGGGLAVYSHMEDWMSVTQSSFKELYDLSVVNVSANEEDTCPDGIWFIHKSCYHLPGLSPFLLHYRDPMVCKWPIDTDPYPNQTTGNYEPAKKMKVRLWVSTSPTAFPGDTPTVSCHTDVAFSAEGIPILKQEGLTEVLQGDSYGVIVVELSDHIELTGDTIYPIVMHDVSIVGKATGRKNRMEHVCQSCDADSLSKIIYLSRARQLHFNGVDIPVNHLTILDAIKNE